MRGAPLTSHQPGLSLQNLNRSQRWYSHADGGRTESPRQTHATAQRDWPSLCPILLEVASGDEGGVSSSCKNDCLLI
jgi:hypothetical protein